MIKINNLSKKYDDKEVVNIESLEIENGELFSLLGVNGAGKTTTIKMLCGLLKPTNGDALINNYSIKKDMAKIKPLINVSTQDTAVASNLTVKENLEFICGIYNLNKNISDKRVKEALALFNLEEYQTMYAHKLSGGNMRKLSIAMALITKPEILFLDEPTLGLDVLARRDLWDIIMSLKGKTTIILTTHYMEEADYLSDRIGIMKKGKIIDVGSSNELKNKTKTKTLEDAFISLVREK